jgi:hypothetical protein
MKDVFAYIVFIIGRGNISTIIFANAESITHRGAGTTPTHHIAAAASRG